MDNYYIIYDIVIAAILLSGVFFGIKRGFLKAVLSAAIYIAALIGANVLSDVYAQPLYMEHIRPGIVSAIADEITDTESRLTKQLLQIIDVSSDEDILNPDNFEKYLTDPEIGDTIRNITQNVFDGFKSGLSESVPDAFADKVSYTDFDSEFISKLLKQDLNGAAESIEEKAIRSFGIKIVGMSIWSLAFAVITAAGKIVSAVILSVRKLDTVRSADKILGGALGLLEACIIIIPIVMVLKLVVSLTDSSAFSEEVINNTFLFKLFYNFINIGG